MINGVVAVERSQGIGFQGTMPWPHLKGDMKWFKSLTKDHIVIMGAVTWKSLPKPLPDRINIVISKDNHSGADHSFKDPEYALEFCRNQYPEKEIFIIGGAAIYTHYATKIDRFFVTEIDAEFECDKFFDLTYVRTKCINVKEHLTYNEPIPYTIKEYTL